MRVTWPKPSTSSSRRGAVPLKPISTEPKSEPPASGASLTQSKPSAGYVSTTSNSSRTLRSPLSNIAGLAPMVSSKGATVT